MFDQITRYNLSRRSLTQRTSVENSISITVFFFKSSHTYTCKIKKGSWLFHKTLLQKGMKIENVERYLVKSPLRQRYNLYI